MNQCSGCPIFLKHDEYCVGLSKLLEFQHNSYIECPMSQGIIRMLDPHVRDDLACYLASADQVDYLMGYLFNSQADLVFLDEMEASGLPEYLLSDLLNRVSFYIEEIKHSQFFKHFSAVMINRFVEILNQHFDVTTESHK